MKKKIRTRLFSNRKFLFVFVLFLIALTLVCTYLIYQNRKSASGTYTTYYVRTDGGTDAQCNGKFDAAYPGTGTNQDCAWKHPYYALPPQGAIGPNGAYTTKITGGDTLIIGPGEYRMGYNPLQEDLSGNNTTSQFIPDLLHGPCYSGSGDSACVMPSIPSGPDPAHPTRILGQGWDTKSGTKPQLWAVERANQIINLTNSNNVEIRWLDLTDHSVCVDRGSISGELCAHDAFPHGDWGVNGIAAKDAQNISLDNLDIHGFASNGIAAGRLADWNLTEVKITSNGSAGWNADVGDDYKAGRFVSDNTGNFNLKKVSIEWSGCAETYPELEPTHCRGQAAGGYGDGLGLARSGGDWLIEDSVVSHNLSDGLDLLYHENGGSITINRVWAEGNAGNNIKLNGNAHISNSVIIGNCAFFYEHPDYVDGTPDFCRAGGTPVVIVYIGGETATITNSTIYSEGDVIIGSDARINCNSGSTPTWARQYCKVQTNTSCDNSEQLIGRNNILYANVDKIGGSVDQSAYFYTETCGDLTFDSDYTIYYNGKMSLYHPGSHDINSDPLLVNNPLTNPLLFYKNTSAFQLSAASPAIDKITGVPGNNFTTVDYLKNVGPEPAGTLADIGAYEYGSQGGPPIIPDFNNIKGYVNKSTKLNVTSDNSDSVSWSKVSGPGTLTFSQSGTVSASAIGDYVIKITASNTYGNEEKTGTLHIYKFADINGNGQIDHNDFFTIVSKDNWRTLKVPLADLDEDGEIKSSDLFILLEEWMKNI